MLEDGLLAVRAVLALERDLARHLGAVLAVLADGGGVAPQLSSFWCSTQRSERVRGRGDDDDDDAPQASAAAIAAHYGWLKRRLTQSQRATMLRSGKRKLAAIGEVVLLATTLAGVQPQR